MSSRKTISNDGIVMKPENIDFVVHIAGRTQKSGKALATSRNIAEGPVYIRIHRYAEVSSLGQRRTIIAVTILIEKLPSRVRMLELSLLK